MCFFFSSRRRHTRYIGDWSSDVCSSDLYGLIGCHWALGSGSKTRARSEAFDQRNWCNTKLNRGATSLDSRGWTLKIGRASCRERVYISVGAVSLKREEESTKDTQHYDDV